MKKQPVKFLLGTREISNNKFAFLQWSKNAELHYHYFVEIVYFVNGTGVHIINGQKHRIQSGDIFLINPFTPHSYQTDKANNNPVEVYNIIFYTNFLSNTDPIVPEQFIDSFYQQLFDVPYKQSAEKTSYIKVHDIHYSFLSLFRMIQDEYTKKDKGFMLSLKDLLHLLLIKLYRCSMSDEQKPVLSSKNRELLNEAVTYLREHATEHLRLEYVAKKYYFSVSYFNRLIKTYLGMTFNEFLQQERIMKAAKLLQDTNLTIDEICGKVGYSDMKFFYSLFLKIIGLPPAKYRAYIRQEHSNLQLEI